MLFNILIQPVWINGIEISLWHNAEAWALHKIYLNKGETEILCEPDDVKKTEVTLSCQNGDVENASKAAGSHRNVHLL